MPCFKRADEEAWHASVHSGPARRQAFQDGFRAGYAAAITGMRWIAQSRRELGQKNPPFIIEHTADWLEEKAKRGG